MFSTVLSSRIIFYQNLRLQLSKTFSNLLKSASLSQTTSFLILTLYTLQIIGLTWAQKSKLFPHDTFYQIIYTISTIIRGDAQSMTTLFDSSLIPKLAFYFLSAITILLFILIVHEIYISAQQNRKKSQFQTFLTKFAGSLYVSAPWILYTPVFNLALAFLYCGDSSPAGQCSQISRWLNFTLSIVVIAIITAFSCVNLYLQFTPYYIVKNNLSSQEMRTRYIRYLHLTISSIILQSPNRSHNSNYVLFVVNILAGCISLLGIIKRFEFINLKLSYFYSLVTPVYLYTAILGFLDFLDVGQNLTYSVLYFVGGGCVASIARVINKRLMDQILLTQIDKLETSRHLDNICRLLWYYLEISAKDPKASILYISYIRNHLDYCEDVACFCKKCSIRVEEYEANSYGQATRFDIDPKISHDFLEGFIAYWYEKGVKEKFPKDFDLFVSYVNFITEVPKNFIMAWLSTTDRKKKNISVREELLLLSIKGNIESKILHNLNDDEYNHHAFYTLALDSENKLRDVRYKMTEALKEYISLFQALDREQLDLGAIQRNCVKVSKLNKDVEKELEKLAQLTEFSSLEIKAYYLYFMDLIVGNPVKKKFQAERDRFKRAGSNLDDYFKDNIGVVLLSLQKDKLGHIETSTRGFTNMLGYNIAELKQKNISALMPSQFGQRHTKFMERFLAYSKDFKSSHESFLSFAQNKSQYVVPLTIRVRIETLSENVYLTGFCDGANVHRCFVLLNSSGRTTSFTQNFFTTTQTLGKVRLEELSGIHIKCFMPNLIDFFDNKQKSDDDLIYQDSFLVLPKDSEALESIKTLPNWIEEKDGGKYANLREKFLEILKADRIVLFSVKFNLTKVVYTRSKITIRLVEILHFSKVRDTRELIEEKEEESPSVDHSPELQQKSFSKPYSTLGEGFKGSSQTNNEFNINSQTNNEFMFSKERLATQSIIALPENFDFQDTEEPFLEVNNMEYKFIETLPDRLQTMAGPSPKNIRNPSPPKTPMPLQNNEQTEDQEAPEMTTFSSMTKKTKKKEKSFKWKKVEMGISQHLSKQDIDLQARSSRENFGFNAKTFKKVKDLMDTQLLIPSLNDDKKANSDEKRRVLFEQRDGLSVQVENSKMKADSEDDKTTHVKDIYKSSSSSLMNKQDVLQSILSSKLPLFIRALRLLGVLFFLLLIAVCCINFGIIYHKIDFLQEQCHLGSATAALCDSVGVLMKQIQKKLMYLDGILTSTIWNAYYLPYFQYIIRYSYTVFHTVFEMSPSYYDYIAGRFGAGTVNLYLIDSEGTVATQSFDNLGILRFEVSQMYNLLTLPDSSWVMNNPAIYYFQKNAPIISAIFSRNHDQGAILVDDNIDEISSYNLAQLSTNLFISGLVLLLILPISYTIQRKVNDTLSLFRIIPQQEISERLNFYENQLHEFEKLITNEDAYQEKFEKMKKERGKISKIFVKEKAQAQKRKQVKNLLSPMFYSVLVILTTWAIILCFLLIGYVKLSSFLDKAQPSYMIVDTCRGIQTFYPNYLGTYYLHLYSEVSTDSTGLITAADKEYQEESLAALGEIVNSYIKDLQTQINQYISKGYNSGNEGLQNIVDAIRNSDMCKVLELSAAQKLECENALFVSNAKSLLAVLQQTYSVLTQQLQVFEINNHDPTLIKAFINSDIFAQNDGMQLLIDKMLTASVETFLNEMDSNVDSVKKILIMCLVLNIIVYLGVIWIIWLPYLNRVSTSLLTARQSLLLLPIETISNNKNILGYFYKEGILKR